MQLVNADLKSIATDNDTDALTHRDPFIRHRSTATGVQDRRYTWTEDEVPRMTI